MKHLARWMICLGLLLNSLLFIGFIVLGFANTPVFLILSLLCYPLSLLLIRLARNNINSKCRFYWQEDAIWWRIIKTLLMPIVASGSLIIFHLVTTTYRKMAEAIEDRTGFSISSVFRMIIGFIIYFVSGLVLYLITTWTFKDDNVASDVSVGVLFLGGIVWIISHFLWDVLDFAEKESDGFIRFKNIAFLILGGLSFVMGIIMFINGAKIEVNFGKMVGLFCMVAGPLCIHFAYYGVNRSGQVPQSKMTFFWGPIAMAITFVYALLVSLLAKNGKAWILVFYILTVLIYAAVIFFVGLPFRPTNGEYRSVYRNIAKQKRIAMAASVGSSSGYSSSATSSSSSSGGSSKFDPEFRDVAYKVANKFGPFSSVHISAIASINNIKVYPKVTETQRITYELNATISADFRGKDPTSIELSSAAIKRDVEYELQKLAQKIVDNTQRELESRDILNDDCNIEVVIGSIKESIQV